VINSKELSHVNSIKEYDWATPSFLGRVLEERRVKVVEGDVAFSKDVFLVETPGHSPGHQSVLVKTDGGSVLFSGDAMPTMRSYIREQPDYIMVSDDAARSSIRKMKSLKPDVYYPGHDRPFRVVDSSPEYLSQTELKLIFRGAEGNFGILLSTENAEKPEKK
jgi:glyoxylase-like metal-dependent hydrolase (beta-lactamase superfamily II)